MVLWWAGAAGKPPGGPFGTACPGTEQGWVAAVQPGNLSPRMARASRAMRVGTCFPHLPPACQIPGWYPNSSDTRQVLVPNLRPKIYHGSTLGFLPTARIPPSLTPRLLQTSPPVKTPKTMIKLDKASRDEIINRWDREGSRSLIFMLAPIRFL